LWQNVLQEEEEEEEEEEEDICLAQTVMTII